MPVLRPTSARAPCPGPQQDPSALARSGRPPLRHDGDRPPAPRTSRDAREPRKRCIPCCDAPRTTPSAGNSSATQDSSVRGSPHLTRCSIVFPMRAAAAATSASSSWRAECGPRSRARRHQGAASPAARARRRRTRRPVGPAAAAPARPRRRPPAGTSATRPRRPAAPVDHPSRARRRPLRMPSPSSPPSSRHLRRTAPYPPTGGGHRNTPGGNVREARSRTTRSQWRRCIDAARG
jgi:hypothetical protein